MIVLDSSAIVAIFLREPEAEIFANVLDRPEAILIAAPTLLECLIVLTGRHPADARAAMVEFSKLYSVEVAAFDEDLATAAHSAFLRYGKGRHPAGLNFGDCISYAFAKSLDAPLLFKGGDFALTDIVPAA